MNDSNPRHTLLIVDDTAESLSVLNETLKAHYQIKAARDGERALSLARSAPHPDLILLDIMMPGIDGFEVCRRLKADLLTRDIPVIFLTARSQIEDEQLGFDVGGADYLLKPVSPPIVQARIRTHLQNKKARDFLLDQNAFLESEVAKRTAEVLAAAEMKAQYAGLQQELVVARRMQASILPQAWTKHPAADVAAFMLPAKEVGGDFYDYFLVDSNHLGVVVADVCGKGVPAAFFMAIARTLLRAHARFLSEPLRCLERLNEQLEGENEQMMFVTLVYGVLDLRDGSFNYVNAGHNPPLLRRAAGAIESLPADPGMALAISREPGLIEGRVQLRTGDTLLLYTDGITEAFDSDESLFGDTRLSSAVEHVPPCARAVDFTDAVLAAVNEFVGAAAQSDDITCLALRYTGRNEAPPRTACGIG